MFGAYQVIRDDVPSAVREMLERNPDLASITVKRDQLFEERICHWLYRGDTLLHLAAAGHRNEIIVAFIKVGANPNASKNRRCSTPLHYAADAVLNEHYSASAQESSIRSLVAAGAFINAQDKNGASALHRAVRTRAAAAVDCLLEAGANPYLLNHNGSTAFHLVVQSTGAAVRARLKRKRRSSKLSVAFCNTE